MAAHEQQFLPQCVEALFKMVFHIQFLML